MRPVRATLTFVGVGVGAAGFLAIAYAWGKVAGLTAVPLQVPYLVSGGLTGLGLVLVGVTLVNLQAKREDAAARDRQLHQLIEILTEVKELLGEPIASPEDATEQLPSLTHTPRAGAGLGAV